MKLTNVVKDEKILLNEDTLVRLWGLPSVDTCGRWNIKCEFVEPTEVRTVKIWALAMIDKGLNWPEIVAIQSKYAEEIVKLVHDYWFNRYPKQLYCIHDNGGKFIGEDFKVMLDSYGVQPKPTTVKNPQSNGLHEQMHLVLCEML